MCPLSGECDRTIIVEHDNDMMKRPREQVEREREKERERERERKREIDH